jgi:pilus assembly protein CpaE
MKRPVREITLSTSFHRTHLKKKFAQEWGHTMKAMVVSNNSKLVDDISALGKVRTPPVSAIWLRGGLPDASSRIATEAPDLVLLDASNTDVNDIDLLGRFAIQYPQVSFMLLTADQSSQMLLRAMRAGVREVLPLPLDHQAFSEALDRVAQKSASLSSRNGKVISFISCKGGSGATFIATNLGYVLADLTAKKILLIDLNQQFGDAALYVSDEKPTITLSDLCAQINRIDAAFLESSLVAVTPHFGILAASDDPGHAVDMKPEHIDTILHLARTCYDFVILDIGRQIDAITIRALDNSDVIYPVLQLALPYIRDGRRLLDMFRSLGYQRNKTRLVVNRYEKGCKLGLPDLVTALGAEVAHTIPNGYEVVTDSVNQGIPVLKLARSSSVAKSLIDFAEQLIERPTVAGNQSVLLRIFRRSATAGA